VDLKATIDALELAANIELEGASTLDAIEAFLDAINA